MRYGYETGLLETDVDRDYSSGSCGYSIIKLFVPGVKQEAIVHAKLTFGNNVARSMHRIASTLLNRIIR